MMIFFLNDLHGIKYGANLVYGNKQHNKVYHKMIISMTGYGRSEKSIMGYTSLVEVRSLNHRFLDVIMRLPRELNAYEESVKEIIRKYVVRGRINVSINLLKDKEAPNDELRIDFEAAKNYKQLLENLQNKLQLKGEIKIDHLLNCSEIFKTDNNTELPKQVLECCKSAIEEAMQNLNTMRHREGTEISEDLKYRLGILQNKIEEIETLSSSRRPEEFNKLYARIEELIKNKEIDRSRLEFEVALLSDKVDVTEECIRFRSHNTLFLEEIKAEGSSGRKLNFLLQEMNREANTIGSKANQVQIAHLVVDLKEETERLREQIQNIE